MKNWELSGNTKIKFGCTLMQIKASVSFGIVSKGDLGGWIESEKSLSDEAWMYPDAVCFKRGEIRGGVIWGGEIWSGVIRGGVIRGGVIWGGVIRGGEIWGGEIRGGVIRGGVIWGGEIWGGVIWGGEIWGGVIRGGVIRGGEIRGGVIWGGEIWGGVIRGGAKIESSDDLFGISPIGSENGYLLIYKLEVGFNITRGCFDGSPKEFMDAVRQTHGNKKYGKMYKAAMQLASMKFGKKFENALKGK